MTLSENRFRLRTRICRRCNNYYKGTKFSKVCPKCMKPEYKKFIKNPATSTPFNPKRCKDCGKLLRDWNSTGYCTYDLRKHLRRRPTTTCLFCGARIQLRNKTGKCSACRYLVKPRAI